MDVTCAGLMNIAEAAKLFCKPIDELIISATNYSESTKSSTVKENIDMLNYHIDPAGIELADGLNGEPYIAALNGNAD